MSKKIVRANNYFSRRWFAVIAASCAAVASMQSAQASERREAFRDFRDNNPGLARNEARRLFNDQFGATFRPMPIDNPGAVNFHHVVVHDGANVPVLQERGNRSTVSNIREPRISNQSTQALGTSTVRLNTGIDLDLSSTDRNITLGQKLFDGVGSIQITVGGETKTVQAGSKVSAAEYVAVKQVLNGGSQEIGLDSAGRANGGKFDLASITNPGDKMRASNFVLPESVTAYGDFSRSSDIRLTGDLDNHGAIYAIASEKRAHSGTIHADDIINHEGALISSNVPTDLGRALGSHAKRVDLGLSASGDLTNYGTISSSGNLTLTAGSGDFTNSGLIESTTGDISFNSGDAVLNINNAGGTVAANSGAIVVRDTSYAGTANSYVTGGDFLSRQFNTNAGQGTTFVNVNNISGLVNQTGSAAHVEVAGGNLTIGDVCLTGDPTYRNQNGSIQITGNISVAEALAIIARDDISVSNNVTISAGNASQGFNISLIAGANITNVNGGADSTTLPPLPATSTLVEFDGASVAGGSISLGTGVSINTRSTGGVNTNGGNVLLAAFKGATSSSGTIAMSDASIQTGGRGSGLNGNVNIIAGASNGTAISAGSISTVGGTGGNGNVFLSTSQPVSSNGGPIQYNGTGDLISSGSLTTSDLTSTASLATKNISAYGAVSLQAGALIGNSSGTQITSTNGAIGLFAGDSIILSSNVVGTNVVMSANNNITVNSIVSTSSPSGLILASAGNTFQITGAMTASGDLTLTAGTVIMLGSGALASSNSDVTINATNNIVGSSFTLISAQDGNISLTSQNGNIGANAGLKLRVNADFLDATAFGGSVYITDLDSLNVTSATAASKVDISSVDQLATTGLVSGDIVNLQSTADAVQIAGNVIAGTSATLDANTDLVTISPARVTAPQLFLTAQSADIGGGGLNLPFRIDADNVVVTAPAGGALLQDPDNLNFGGGNTFVASRLVASANGLISNSSTITGDIIGLSSTTASVSVNNTINAATSVSLQQSNTFTNANISATINTPSLLVASTNNDVGSSANPFTSGNATITASAPNGSVWLNATNTDATVGGVADTSYNLVGAGTVRVSITANDTVNITAPTKILTTGAITAPTVSLTSGSIGDSSNVVTINSQSVDLAADTDIFVVDTSNTAVTINSATGTNTLSFNAQNADLVSAANFSQNTINLATGGVFNLSGNLQNTGSIILTSAGSLTNAQLTGTLSTNGLALKSTSGSVGTSTASPFIIADGVANIIRANSPALGGIFIQSETTDEIALTETTSNLDINFVAAGPLRIIGDVTSANGNVNLTNQSGTLTVSSGVDIKAFDQINIINSGTNKKTSKIVIEADASIVTNANTAGQGNVTIQLGAPQTKVVTKAPKNVTIVENGGDVEIRGKSFKAVGPVNTLTAKGANLVISNGINAKNLTMGGGVIVTADPETPPANQNIVIVVSTTGGSITADPGNTVPSGNITIVSGSSNTGGSIGGSTTTGGTITIVSSNSGIVNLPVVSIGATTFASSAGNLNVATTISMPSGSTSLSVNAGSAVNTLSANLFNAPPAIRKHGGKHPHPVREPRPSKGIIKR